MAEDGRAFLTGSILDGFLLSNLRRWHMDIIHAGKHARVGSPICSICCCWMQLHSFLSIEYRRLDFSHGERFDAPTLFGQSYQWKTHDEIKNVSLSQIVDRLVDFAGGRADKIVHYNTMSHVKRIKCVKPPRAEPYIRPK